MAINTNTNKNKNKSIDTQRFTIDEFFTHIFPHKFITELIAYSGPDEAKKFGAQELAKFKVSVHHRVSIDFVMSSNVAAITIPSLQDAARPMRSHFTKQESIEYFRDSLIFLRELHSSLVNNETFKMVYADYVYMVRDPYEGNDRYLSYYFAKEDNRQAMELIAKMVYTSDKLSFNDVDDLLEKINK